MLYEEIHDKFNYDWGTEEVYENATVETLNIFIISDSEKKIFRTWMFRCEYFCRL